MQTIETVSGTTVPVAQGACNAAIDEWIESIRAEEDLASINPSLSQVDIWEHAHFSEEEARKKAEAARKQYEDAVRRRLFGF